MVINQLFNEKPPLELINKLITKFGLVDINDTTEFCSLDMDRNNTLLNFKQLEHEIQDYYIQCKRNKFFNDINNKSIITILRHLVKLYEHDLIGREKFIKGVKYIVYKIITKQDKEFSKRTKKYINKKEITIVFD